MSGEGIAHRHDEWSGTARRSLVVAGWTLVSRATGMLRVLVLGACLGPTLFANGVQTALVVPNMVYTVIAGSLVGMVVIPVVLRHVDASGTARGAELMARISGCLLLGGAFLGLASMCIAPLIAQALTFAVNAPEHDHAQPAIVLLIVLVAPQTVLYVIAALGVAAQHARGRFALAAAAPAVENLVVIASILLASWFFGFRPDPNTVHAGFILILGLGSTGAVGLHAGLQVFGAARVGLVARPRLDVARDPAARAALIRMRNSAGIAAFPSVQLSLMLVVAGTVPGGVLIVQIAQQVFSALSHLGPRAVSTAAMPLLSDVASRFDEAGYASAWRSTVFCTVMASMPVLVLLTMFAEPTANLLSLTGIDSAALLDQLAGCLTIVAAAQLVSGIHDTGRQALFARLENRTPVKASACALVVGLGTCVAAALVDDTHRLIVVTGTVLLAEVTAASIVLVRLRATIRPETLLGARSLRVLLSGGISLVLVALIGRWVLATTTPSGPGTVAMLVLIGTVAVAAYAMTMRLALLPVRGRTP